MKKKLQKVIDAINARLAKNTLSDDASAMWEEVRAAFETLAEDGQEHTITELADQFEQIKAKYESQDEEIQNRIQKVRDEVMTIVKGNKNVKDQFTPEVRRAIANAIHSAHNLKEVKENIAAVCKANAIEIRTKRDSVSGLSFAEVIDYALQLKQENNDEIFDGLRKTNRSKFFYGELDPTNPSHIAKQWDKTSETQKAEQELAVNGKTITTAYIYKLQSLAHEDLDDAREAADEVRLLADIRDELRRAVKGLAVRAMLVGDAYNPNGSKVTVFETIGTKTTSDLFTTVVNPATANTPNIADLRKAASKVKTERKWAVMTSDLKLLLSERPQGADSHFYTDAELAAQIGVDRVIDRDFIGDVTGLHAVIFGPDEYWVKEKNVIDTAFPEFRDNRQGYIYEINMGGAIHGLESTAVLREA